MPVICRLPQGGGGGVEILGQGEAIGTYAENLEKGELVTVRRFYGRDDPQALNLPDDFLTRVQTSLNFSFDGKYMVLGSNSTPYILLYKREGDTFTKLPNLPNFPSGSLSIVDVVFSPNNKYMAIALGVNPWLIIYKMDKGDTFTKLPNPVPLNPALAMEAISFSSDGKYLVALQEVNSSEARNIFKIEDDVFTRMPLILFGQSYPDEPLVAAFSPDSKLLVIAGSSKYSESYHTFRVEDDNFTQLDGMNIPKNSREQEVYDIKFSPMGDYFASSSRNVRGENELCLYKIVNGEFTRIPNPEGLTTAKMESMSFSSDGKYFALTDYAQVMLGIYKIINGKFIKLPNPRVIPVTAPRRIAYSPLSEHLAVIFNYKPYIIIYKDNILGDYIFPYIDHADLYKWSNYVDVGVTTKKGFKNEVHKIITLPIKEGQK